MKFVEAFVHTYVYIHKIIHNGDIAILYAMCYGLGKMTRQEDLLPYKHLYNRIYMEKQLVTAKSIQKHRNLFV